MLPNPPAFEYTGESTESHALTLMQLPNIAAHKEGCTQKCMRLVPAQTHPEDINSNKRRLRVHIQ